MEEESLWGPSLYFFLFFFFFFSCLLNERETKYKRRKDFKKLQNSS